MLQERLSKHVDELIGPRLRLSRVLILIFVLGLDALNTAQINLESVFSWKLNEAYIFFPKAIASFSIGYLLFLVIVVLFLVPRVSYYLLAMSSKLFLFAAKPMLLKLAGNRHKRNIGVNEVKKLLEEKSFAVKKIHEISDVFEIYVFLLVWMLVPDSYFDLRGVNASIFICWTVILGLLFGYSVNYLIVTKITKAEISLSGRVPFK